MAPLVVLRIHVRLTVTAFADLRPASSRWYESAAPSAPFHYALPEEEQKAGAPDEERT